MIVQFTEDAMQLYLLAVATAYFHYNTIGLDCAERVSNWTVSVDNYSLFEKKDASILSFRDSFEVYGEYWISAFLALGSALLGQITFISHARKRERADFQFFIYTFGSLAVTSVVLFMFYDFCSILTQSNAGDHVCRPFAFHQCHIVNGEIDSVVDDSLLLSSFILTCIVILGCCLSKCPFGCCCLSKCHQCIHSNEEE
eukprot:UN24408